ncbi:MAG: chorismate mutase [Oscillospiraceae bacterium]|nr:chorismate mutase [Oscillospiraceae bacterium]
MELSQLREQIDDLDRQIVALLEQRLDVAEGIAHYKLENGLPVLDEAREEEKLAAIQALCRPETGDALRDVYVHILAASRSWQTRLMEGSHGE